jgi:hypothetical protein
MSPSSEVDISRALDTAETREAGGDPVTRKLKIALQGGKEKYGWIPHNSSFGFLDIVRPTLGVFASLDRF